MSLPLLDEDTKVADDVGGQQPWVVLVWNDPVNLMSYVTYVFQSYFGYPREKAERLMWQVHNEGRAQVSSGHKESMERHVVAMHTYGLWATLEKEGGL